MIRFALAMLASAVLVACGADGPPIAPVAKSAQAAGLVIGGEASIGLAQNATK